ncbi:uncharacterized protein LOC128299243 [Anopheles moucheti]|uniref:uncharacterized protein LOC128299243 n=1 Tax=Anopheles moucheti TaxID=186751 RepID=UPI0022F13D9D|nr:uncharacterized protein LOC128299243 [Anopheles moucheti]
MVSPSKAKLSRIAGQQQQQEEQEAQQQQLPSQQASQRKSKNKVQLVKGPKPLVYHRFYLDIEQHQVATKIETTIKQLGGSIEFFLNKDITHFITDKLQPGDQPSGTVVAGETGECKEHIPSVAPLSSGVAGSIEKPSSAGRFPSVPSPVTGTPLLQQPRHPQQQQPLHRSSRQLLHLTHQQQTHGQYVNDYESATSRTSSPCPPPITSSTTAAVPSSSAGACITTSRGAASGQKQQQQQQQIVLGSGSASSTATSVGFDGKVKPIHLSSNSLPTAAVPRSRADAMLQRVRQQQQQQTTQYSQQPSYNLLHSSPLNPTTSGLTYGSTPTKVSTPSPFQPSSHHKQEPSPSYSPAGAGVGNLGVVSRTGAAPRQNSPVQLVRSWGSTLIWSAEYALKFLRKVLSSLPTENGAKRPKSGAGSTDLTATTSGRHRHHRHHHGSSATRTPQHVHHLRGPFIKIESLTAPCSYRPVYKEFKRWPVLLWNEQELVGKKSPFADANEPTLTERKQLDEQATGRKGAGLEVATVEGTSTTRMTRKLSSTVTNNTTAAARTGSITTAKNGETVTKKRPLEKRPAAPPRDCGYCEICRIEYDSLVAHIQSESHQTFVRNDDNFASLDRLLDSFGGGGDSGDGTALRQAEGYDTEDSAVAVEAFFQQLQNTTRIKRDVQEELFERRRVSCNQLKAVGEGKQERQERDEKEQEGQHRKTSSTTVTVAVTTTTTAAADELIEKQNTPIGDTITTEAAVEVQQEQPLKQSTPQKEQDNNAANEENERLLQCTQQGGKRAKVKRKLDADHSEQQQRCERLDSNLQKHSTPRGSDGDGNGSKKDSSDCGNNTQELIKFALKSVIATFECSDSDFLEDVERTLGHSVRFDDSSVQCTAGSVKEQQQVDNCAHSSKLESGSDSNKRAANSNSNNLTTRDSSSTQPPGQRTTRIRACKRQTEAVSAVIPRGERRSSRISSSVAVVPVPSAFREVTGTLEYSTEASSEGMFGRRSAIHHHPHNQLNHHNHQKHKSTLSALLLKQQQERDQQQHQLGLLQQTQQPPSAVSTHEWCVEHNATTSGGTLDHAAGMKVLTDFRKQRADDELVPDKSVLLVGSAAEATVVQPASATIEHEKLGILDSAIVKPPTTGGGNRRKRNPRSEQQEDAMGLKASTIAMNKHHHHHTHVAHLNDGGGGGATGAGSKTRHATELTATLLECDGLDPKNTKRISLGLRQNPKRANLNEDFTSLLDETLERSKTSNSSSARRTTAQSRIRGQTKGKEQTVSKLATAAGKGDEEKQNRGCEDEKKEQNNETQENERLTSVAEVATSTKRAVGKKAAALEDIKVRGIRWRAPSPTTRPPVKSPLLYKVIDHQTGEEPISTSDGANERIAMSSSRTATATGVHASRKESSTASYGSSTNTQLTSNQLRSPKSSTAGKASGALPGKKNGLIVKIRRVRQSELSLLNDEAENFMFPRKDDSSSDEDTDDDRQTSSEGFHAAGVGNNNYSVDLASSSEGDRGAPTIKLEEDRHSEEEQHASLSDEKQQQNTGTTGVVVGSRKRKKATAATSARAISLECSDHLSSPTSRTSPLKSNASSSVGPVLKRARLEPNARRKGQQTADYDKGQDPADTRLRFPEAPIQPSTTVAVTKGTVSSTDRLRRRRSQSSVSEDKGHEEKQDDGDEAKASDDYVEEDVEEGEKKAVQERRGKRRKGGVRGRRIQRQADREEDTVPSSSTSLPSQTILCISCVARSNRGRGRGGVAGRRGRRGVRGGGVGRGGRRANRLKPGASCTCHLLDATRMPPPSSRRRNHESVERSGTPVSQRSTGTRASKTKTTPPNAAGSSSSLAAASSSIMGNNSLCGSYIKGKEDGMGAVFKWINFRKRCEEIEPYRFAFERVPSLEPWYETFQRQDDGTEKVYEYFGSTGYRKLPYEMGPLPALGQNCCILNYKVVASRKSNRTASLQSSSSASMEPASPSSSKNKAGTRLNSSEGQHFASSGSASHSASAVNEPDSKKSSPSSSLSSLPLKKRKLLLQDGAGSSSTSHKTDGNTGSVEGGGSHSSRIARLIAGGNERPRKSPREHASTLAILSLLQQQQHRKRAGTIKILTSPKKATTATATQTTILHDQLLHQDADSNGEELSRSCSRASDRGSSRAGSSNGGGGIKFERPLFPDSTYVNSRTLCQELDAFLSDELKRVAGEETRSPLDGIVKKELSECLEADDEHELLADGTLVQNKAEDPALEMPELDQEWLPPPSVVQEGIAIERDGLSVSKRDLLDVLQTVGTEPPLSLKLVQRCESVVKKIVQYDRKERSMLASGSGSGLAISSASPVIGLQLFDSGSSLVACGPGSGAGNVGGSFLKKRINRTGWPTNKRKIGTRTRQQSRFMLPSLSTTKKSMSRESVKKEEPEEGEEEHSKDGNDVSQQCVSKKQDDDEDTDDEDDGEDDEEDAEVVAGGRDVAEDDEEDDDADTIVDEQVEVSPARCTSRKDVAQATINEKTDSIRRKEQEVEQETVTKRSEPKTIERRRRKRSFGKQHNKYHASKASCIEQRSDDEKKNEENAAVDATELDSLESLRAKSCEKERNTIAYDSMPTLRAALMRDNSQLQRNMASSMVLPSSPSKSSLIPPFSVEIPERGSLRKSSIGLSPGSSNRGTVPHTGSRGTPAVSCESLLCPASSPGSGPVLGANCCKYVTKTTTTMTRVDYDGGGNVTSSGLPAMKLKHSREDVSTNNEEEEQQHVHREDNRQKQSCTANRYRGTTSSSTAIGSAVLSTTHDSDDKECDSISSRSIFVSDDCDTTSSSTAINPPDDRPPSTGELPSVSTGHSNHLHHTETGAVPSHLSDVTSSSSLPINQRLAAPPTARVRRRESSENEESLQNETESTHNERPSEQYLLVDKPTKTPRTPSERIRNKMVRNRRVAIRLELATVAAASKKQDVTKTHDVQTRTVPSSKRRKSSSLGPPLPPPTVMPLSPPLTTSTSSSSSSSYGADEKAPLSPLGVVTSVRRKTHIDDSIIGEEELLQDEQSLQHSSSGRDMELQSNAEIALTPSKIKTRSSTFGPSPAKRTYGGAKLSSKKLPFVSLIKTTYVPAGVIEKVPTLVNGTMEGLSKKDGNKQNRRTKSVEKTTSNKSSPTMKKVLKKRQEPKQNVTMAKKKQIKANVGGVVGKKNKKVVSARPKQIAARKKLKKPVEDAATSGHLNNNTGGAFTNDGPAKEEDEDPLGSPLERENSSEQQDHHHHTDEERNHRQHHHTTPRVPDLMEEHLLEEEEEEEEEELLERNAGGEDEDLHGVDEEEHYELLELMEIEEQAEEEELGDEAEDEEEEEEIHQVGVEEEEEEEEEDAFLTGEDDEAAEQQQKRQDDEERKLIMADHDYSDQHVDPSLADAEFVEVEELEEDDLESDDDEDIDDGEPEEVEEEEMEQDEVGDHDEEEEDDDDDEDANNTLTQDHHPCRVAPSALNFGKQQRVKVTFASSSGASATLAIASATPTTVAPSGSATGTKNFTTPTSSPTKYSPRKLRKPRGRWYRER